MQVVVPCRRPARDVPRGFCALQNDADQRPLRRHHVFFQEHARSAFVVQGSHALHRQIQGALVLEEQDVLLSSCTAVAGDFNI